MRYLTPVLFAAATAWMWHYNGTNDHRKLALPFVEALFPETVGNPVALGERSVEVALAITVVVAVLTVVGHVRDLRRARLAAEVDADEG